MTHPNTPPKIPLHKRRPPTTPNLPRLPGIAELATARSAAAWLDQLTGHPAQTYTLCQLDSQIHILYLRLRQAKYPSHWQGYLISGLGHSRSICHLLTDPTAIWSDDRLASLHLTFTQLNQARAALTKAFLVANQIPFNRIIRFTRPRA